MDKGPEALAIDAMVADLDANAGLPDHLTVKYRRPRAILPQDCPLLFVGLDESGSLEAPQTTVRFRAAVPIALEWHLAAVEEVQTLIDDEDLSLALIDGGKRILARARKWAIETTSLGGVSLGVTGVDETGQAAMIPFALEDGYVEGVRIVVPLFITESA